MEPIVERMLKLLDEVAPILLIGERGTGKDYLVKQVSQESDQDRQVTTIDCSLPPDEVSRSLFGYLDRAVAAISYEPEEAIVKGAIERAEGGILYLDHIDRAHPDTVHSVCELLRSKNFSRIGDCRAIPVRDVWIIASSCPHPFSTIPESHLGPELLILFRGRILPLSSLRHDTNIIVPRFVEFLRQELKSIRKPIDIQVDDELADMLRTHHWPNNFYELKQIAKRVAQKLSTEPRIDHDFVSNAIQQLGQNRTNAKEDERRARCAHFLAKVQYQGNSIGLDRLYEWIQQFSDFSYPGGIDARDLAEEILRAIDNRYFYSNQRLKEILKKAFLQINTLIDSDEKGRMPPEFASQIQRRRIRLVNPVEQMKSPGIILRLLRECGLAKPKDECNFDRLVEVVAESQCPSVVMFVDDFMGTGEQFVSKLVNKLSADKNLESLVEHRKDIIFVGIICVAFSDAVSVVTKSIANAPVWLNQRFHLVIGEELSGRDMAFSPASIIFPEPNVREEAKAIFVEDIGKKLYTEWPEGRGRVQGLVVFEHNTPNNSLPIIWKNGPGKFRWNPLFPRYS